MRTVPPWEEVGDMDRESFRRSASRLVEWIADYLGGGAERYPVLSRRSPGDILATLPSAPPESGLPMRAILDDFERLLVPGLTHWNHPGFMAYFPSTGSGPGVLAEFLAAALNQQAMLWRTSPTATELELVALSWLRQLIHLPVDFEGVTLEGGSSTNLHALLAARQHAVGDVRARGLAARDDVPPLRVYCSELAHSSVEKAALVLGLGHVGLRKIGVDAHQRMRVDELAAAMGDDTAAGMQPVAVVATVGTTACGSVDPVAKIAELCTEHQTWLHVDASWAGAAAMLPEAAAIFEGVERADSIVVSPHKWLFTPLDLSALFCRRMDVLESSLALSADYLATPASDGPNLMDRGIALGRRFRGLKLWMVMSYFGAAGLRARLREHIRLASVFADALRGDPDFELMAPVSLALVCFRAVPREVACGDLDELNGALLERVNARGEVLLSSTRLAGRRALRLVVGHIRTQQHHVRKARQQLRGELDLLLAATGGPRRRREPTAL